MELRVPETLVSESIHGRRRNRSAKCATCAEADIVGQDEQDVRGTFMRLDLLWEILGGLLDRAADVSFEGLLGPGKYILRPRRKRKSRGERDDAHGGEQGDASSHV